MRTELKIRRWQRRMAAIWHLLRQANDQELSAIYGLTLILIKANKKICYGGVRYGEELSRREWSFAPFFDYAIVVGGLGTIRL